MPILIRPSVRPSYEPTFYALNHRHYTINFFTAAFAATALVLQVAAYPGQDIKGEIFGRRNYLDTAKATDLSHCSAQLEARGVEKRAAAHRWALAEKTSSSFSRRASEDNNKTSLSDLEFTPETPLGIMFAGDASCVMSPEVTEGSCCKWIQIRCRHAHIVALLMCGGCDTCGR